LFLPPTELARFAFHGRKGDWIPPHHIDASIKTVRSEKVGEEGFSAVKSHAKIQD